MAGTKPNSVSVLIPCGGGVDPRAMQSMMTAAASAALAGIRITHIGVTDRTLIHTARNYLAEEFLASDTEWAMWFDSDMTFPPETIIHMLRKARELNATFLTGIYHQRMGEHRPILAVKKFRTETGFEHEVPNEYECAWVIPSGPDLPPFQVDAVGFGCVLVHRSVFEGMPKPYFRFLFEDGKKEVSEDFYFCHQARKKGIPIWAIPDLKLGHIAQGRIITRDDFKLDRENVVKLALEPIQEVVQ